MNPKIEINQDDLIPTLRIDNGIFLTTVRMPKYEGDCAWISVKNIANNEQILQVVAPLPGEKKATVFIDEKYGKIEPLE